MRYRASLLVLFLLLPCSSSKQIPLIGLFTSESSVNGSNRSSSIMIDYALTHLRKIDTIKTQLSIQEYQSQIPCDMAVGTKVIFDMIHKKPRPMAIFSGSCQLVASAIAETAGILDLTIVFYLFMLMFSFLI